MDRLIDLGLESLQLGLLSSDRYYKKPLIIFNSAGLCGFTKQLIEFQEIYESAKAVPIALPTNEFGNQEPGDDIEISQFYQNKYGVTFPIAKKANLNHIVFEKHGTPSWNFNKYLFDKDHIFVNRFESTVLPKELLNHV
jgi:glutathione peroxidase|tara:strand:+ start:132 stop:548 length:417 start_codon:yes stop_codon:yes gene_type:complete